jgi:branched-chain amino acid transport system substrate-binding protein
MVPRIFAATVLAALTVLSGCGGNGGKDVSLNLTIGNIAPLSGYLSDFGRAGQSAADLAGEEIDKALADIGADHTVTIEHRDDRTAPRVSVRVARELVDAGASCLVGPWTDATAARVIPAVAIQDRIPLISPAAAGDALYSLHDGDLINRTVPPDSFQGPALADVMETDLGGAQGKRVNVAASRGDYGSSILGAFGRAWRAKGGVVGKAVRYGPRQRNYRVEAQEIVSADPEAYLIVDTVETYQRVGRALARTDQWDAARTFVTDSLVSSDLPEAAGVDATRGLRGTTPGAPSGAPGTQAFQRLAQASSLERRAPADAATFDAVVLCYLAAVAAGSSEGSQIAANVRAVSGPGGQKYTFEQLPDAIRALEEGDDIDYEGASGPIDLNVQGNPGAGVYDMFRYDDRGLTVYDQAPFEQPGRE